MRRTARRLLERALVGSGFAAGRRRAGTGTAVVLAYHNIVPSLDPPRGDSSLHLPLDAFRAQLDLLQEHFRVVSLSQLPSLPPPGDRPLAAITFDDAYRGTLELGLPELRTRGLPASLFVPPGLLGTDGFWWDRIAMVEGGGVEDRIREQALRQLGGRQDAILRWAAMSGIHPRDMPELYRPAEEVELGRAAGSPGLALASHTWSHVNLATVDAGTMEEELRRSLEWLAHLDPPGEPLLTYPYGSWTPEVAASAKAAGYAMAFRVSGGRISFPALASGPHRIPRVNVPRGMSPEGFLTRVSGAWPC